MKITNLYHNIFYFSIKYILWIFFIYLFQINLQKNILSLKGIFKQILIIFFYLLFNRILRIYKEKFFKNKTILYIVLILNLIFSYFILYKEIIFNLGKNKFFFKFIFFLFHLQSFYFFHNSKKKYLLHLVNKNIFFFNFFLLLFLNKNILYNLNNFIFLFFFSIFFVFFFEFIINKYINILNFFQKKKIIIIFFISIFFLNFIVFFYFNLNFKYFFLINFNIFSLMLINNYMNNNLIKVRFAPSPTGEIHIGNLRTAIFNYLYAKQNQGKFFLRIEDTDLNRSNVIYEEQIKNILKWLSISYEEKVLRQSERFSIYLKIAENLKKNSHAYYCNCEVINEEIKTCDCEYKNFTSGVLRFLVPRNIFLEFQDEILGLISVNTNTIENFIILRSDSSPTYNFTVVVDDIELGITNVFRGNEHLYNTFKQILIYRALKEKIPLFGHFPMINGKDGKKLSKRSGDTSVFKYREMGILPEAMFNFLIRLGWGYGNQEIFSYEEALNYFNIKKISKSPAIFSMDKLLSLNNYYLQKNYSKYTEIIYNYMEKKIDRKTTEKEKEKILKILEEFSKRSKLLTELADSMLFIFINKNNYEKNSHLIINKDLLKEVISFIENIDENDWKEEILKEKISHQFNTSLKDVCSLFRLIILNKNISPSIFLILSVLDKNLILFLLKQYI